MTDQIPTVIDGTVLDQEFELDVMLAQDLMKQMKLSEDRRICSRYLTQCHQMKSDNIEIKINRNRFFRYLLKTMKKTVATQKDNYHINLPEEFANIEKAEGNQIKQFSEDGRTYIAAKIIPGYATLIYMAVTNTPNDGWDFEGFAKVASYIPDDKEAIEELMKKFRENQEKAQEENDKDLNKTQDNAEEN